jgi:phage protein D
MTPPAAAQHIAGAEVRIAGQPLNPKLSERLIEVRVQDSLMLPGTFLIRLADPELEQVDAGPLRIGAEVEILFAASDAPALASVLTGQIAALEPEFCEHGVTLAARGYEYSHTLHRTRRTQAFQNVTADDVARTIAGQAGLHAGTIDSAEVPQEFIQQSNETDWEFLWRLAIAIDFEVVVAGKALHFRRAGGAPGGQAVALRWGERLRSFRPRVSGVQQVDEVVVRGWDMNTKQPISSSAGAVVPASQIGIARDEVIGSLGGGATAVGDRPVSTQDEADALANSVASHLANAFVEAEGIADGDPRLRAGARVEIDGVGTQFGGTYGLTATTHSFRGTRGYQTLFTISGRAPRSLIDLMTPAPPRNWAEGPVVGLVTQNDDPEGLGRVRVKYPGLGDATEGWWARIAAASAGAKRGLLMTPVIGEEVLVDFEHGDVRKPYVLGSLWNGQDKPQQLVQTDGSFSLSSDHRIVIEATEQLSVTSGGDATFTVGGDLQTAADGDREDTAGRDATLKGGKSVTVSGATEVVIESQGSVLIKALSLKLEASGVVQISGSQIMLG